MNRTTRNPQFFATEKPPLKDKNILKNSFSAT